MVQLVLCKGQLWKCLFVNDSSHSTMRTCIRNQSLSWSVSWCHSFPKPVSSQSPKSSLLPQDSSSHWAWSPARSWYNPHSPTMDCQAFPIMPSPLCCPLPTLKLRLLLILYLNDTAKNNLLVENFAFCIWDCFLKTFLEAGWLGQKVSTCTNFFIPRPTLLWKKLYQFTFTLTLHDSVHHAILTSSS